MSFFGQNFFDGDIVITTNDHVWSAPTFHNTTWITARSPPGTGGNYPVGISIDGFVSTINNATYFYRRPSMSDLTSPPTGGGTLQIVGDDFGTVTSDISIAVGQEGCSSPCVGPNFLNGKLQCQYLARAKKTDCRYVTVTVNKQTSDPVQYCYGVDKGEMTGFPVGVQRVVEQGTLEYTIDLTEDIPPKSNVLIALTATPSNSAFACTVVPANMTFKTNGTTPQSVVVTTVGNAIDEGTEATVYECKILHTIETNDVQYKDSPSRIVAVHIINDDEADVKLWTVNPKDNSYDYDVKFIGPLCTVERGNVSYGIRLDTEPRALVTVSLNVTLEVSAEQVLYPPTLAAIPRSTFVFGPGNWNATQRVDVHLFEDDVAHDTLRFEIAHNIWTADLVFLKKATARPIIAVVDATDDDAVGIDVQPSNTLVSLTEGGESVTVVLAQLRSQPSDMVDVLVTLPSPFVNASVDQVSIAREAWNDVHAPITFQALIGAPPGNMMITLQPRSTDPKYNTTDVAVSINVVILSAYKLNTFKLRQNQLLIGLLFYNYLC
jgi:hypothetical protein